MGLRLNRKLGEVIYIASDIKITVNALSRKRVALHVEAPESIKILRGEVRDADLKREQKQD
jgi:carbon storage regulator CsrA